MNVKTIKRIRGSNHPKVEKALFYWFLSQRKQNKPLTQNLLVVQMNVFHQKLCTKSQCDFKNSRTVIELFRKRHGIRFLTHSGEKLSSKIDGIPKFKEDLMNKIQSRKLTLENLYNADESGLQFKMTPSKTLVANLIMNVLLQILKY